MHDHETFVRVCVCERVSRNDIRLRLYNAGASGKVRPLNRRLSKRHAFLVQLRHEALPGYSVRHPRGHPFAPKRCQQYMSSRKLCRIIQVRRNRGRWIVSAIH